MYVGDFSRKVREYLWLQVVEGIGEGNAVMAWRDPSDEAGFRFETTGRNRRVPVDYDGVRLVEFLPDAAGPADGSAEVRDL